MAYEELNKNFSYYFIHLKRRKPESEFNKRGGEVFVPEDLL